MITYRSAKTEDYRKLVLIHKEAFKGFFLTSLGDNFLETYYRSSLGDDRSIGICAINELGQVVGFATGSALSAGFHKHLVLSNLTAFIKALIYIAFSKPLALVRITKNFSKKGRDDDKGDYSELLSIGILPEYGGLGIGKQILKEFELEAAKHGSDRVALTTDLYNNDHVIGFYKKSGYVVMYEMTAYPDRKMLKMIKSLK